jgi:hypothetical protein
VLFVQGALSKYFTPCMAGGPCGSRNTTTRLSPLYGADVARLEWTVEYKYCVRVQEPLWKLNFLAWHRERPKHLQFEIKNVSGKPRQKKKVQLFDSDRNRDMEANCEKWNSDAGFKEDAETAVQQNKDRIVESLTQKGNRIAVGQRGVVGEDPDRRKYQSRAKFYADLLASYMEAANGEKDAETVANLNLPHQRRRN